jgi:SAM-dependent methyltransferase
LRNTPLHPQWLLRAPDDPQGLHSITGNVLDVGCADKRARASVPGASRYVGLDHPQTVSRLYHTEPDVYADAEALPFPCDTFDGVLLLHVLEHVPDPHRAVHEALRVLRAGGRLVIETPFLYPVHDDPFDFQRWTPRGLERLVERHGGTVLERRTAGRPAETGAVVFNLGLGLTLLEWARRRSPWLALAPALAVVVVLVNLTGWLLGHLVADSASMPHRIRLVCTKVG